MKRSLLLCALSALTLGGCTLPSTSASEPLPENIDDEIQPGANSASALPMECRPNATVDLEDLYDLTEASVHELITCGGIQMQVTFSMKLMIFASNQEIISESARSDLRSIVSALGMTVDNPFRQGADGSWTMEAGGAAGSTFALTFYDPLTNDLVGADPFSLDSYLVGVTATSSRTWEEMQMNPTANTTFTYHWTEEGPLAHLLADGGPIPNPIVLEMSLLDLGGGALGFSEVDYGPFASAQDILVESKIHMVDDRGGADIAYDVTGRRSTVRELVESGALPFDVDSLMSTTGNLTLDGNTSGLAYVGRGSLAGEIHYTASGAVSGVRVVSDFGAGMAYPTPRWECF